MGVTAKFLEGYAVFGAAFYTMSTAGTEVDFDPNEDWTWFVGHYREDWWNEKEFAAACYEYLIPTIADGMSGGSFEAPVDVLYSSGVSLAEVYAVLSTTKPSGVNWRYGPTSGIISKEITIQSGAPNVYVTRTATLQINTGVDISGKNVYLYFYRKSPNGAFGSSTPLNALVLGKRGVKPSDAELEPSTSTFRLTITKDTNTTLTVKRTSSPNGGSTGDLISGATIYSGDVLAVTFAPKSGYTAKCYVNGTAIGQPYTKTVDGNVTVRTEASLKEGPETDTPGKDPHLLTLVGNELVELAVTRGGKRIYSGAEIWDGDELTIKWRSRTWNNAVCKINDEAITADKKVVDASWEAYKTYTHTVDSNTIVSVELTRIVTEHPDAVYHRVNAYLDDTRGPKNVHIVQYDQTSKLVGLSPMLAVRLMLANQPYTVAEDVGIHIRFRKPDRHTVYEQALGTNREGTVVYVFLTEQFTAAFGRGFPIVELSRQGAVVGTAPFAIDIDKNPIQNGELISGSSGQTETVSAYMRKDVYDPQERGTDVFAYTDQKADEAAEKALAGSVTFADGETLQEKYSNGEIRADTIMESEVETLWASL